MNLILIASSYSNLTLFNTIKSQFSLQNNIYPFVLDTKCKDFFNGSEVLSLKKKEYIETLNSLKPDYIVFDASANYKSIGVIVEWAKQNKIKTICLMNHRKRLDKDFQLLEKPDYILTSSDEVIKSYQKKSKVIPVKPFIPHWVKKQGYKYSKKVNFENPTIMYISQNNRPFYTYFLINLYRKVIPKQHPIYIKEHYSDKKREWGRFSAPYFKLDATKTEDVIEKMLCCDLIIGEDSELLFIASALGIPTIFMNLDYKDDFKSFFENHEFKRHFIPEAYRGKKITIYQALMDIFSEKEEELS